MTTQERSSEHPPGFAQYSLGDTSADGTEPGARIGSLCSGYGGLELGLMDVVGGSVAWHVEYDKHPSAVLDARFPGVPNYGDITTTDWSQVEPVGWVTAGYPCQPFSHAGKRKGSADERHLWPFVAAAIGALRPGRVLLENVAGHVSLGLDAVLWDLAALGYDATWGVVRAADAGAPHSRARVFIVAGYSQGDDQRHVSVAASRGQGGTSQPPRGAGGPVADACGGSLAGATAARDGLPVAPECGGEPSSHTAGSRRARTEDCGAGRSDARTIGSRGPQPQRDGGSRSTADTYGTSREALSGRQGPGNARRLQPLERGGAATADAEGSRRDRRRARGGQATDGAVLDEQHLDTGAVAWGTYGPAVRRWEFITGRPAPRPTEPGRTGERLSPRFVEWMQGLPAGWVTDVLPRNPSLKCLGNGVVPQQASLAVRTLLDLEAVAA